MKVLLIDDDKQFIEQFRSSLQKTMYQRNQDIIIDDLISDFFAFHAFDSYDVFFLDIDLQSQEIDGIEIAQMIKEHKKNACIVFVSGRIQLMHDTFAIQPLYFIRKPNLQEDMMIFLDLFQEVQEQFHYIVLNIKDNVIKLYPNQILYAESYKHNVTIHTTIGKFELRSNLEEVIQQLKPADMIQIHRSIIVNVDRIKGFSKGEVELEDGVFLQIGKTYKGKVKQAYMQRIGYVI